MERRRLADIVSCKLRYAVLCTHLSFSGCLLLAHIGSLKKDLCIVASFERSFYHASRADGALTFLCFAKEK